MEYIVVEDSVLNALIREVNKRISEGFIPIGGICRGSTDGIYPIYCQAMLKGSSK